MRKWNALHISKVIWTKEEKPNLCTKMCTENVALCTHWENSKNYHTKLKFHVHNFNLWTKWLKSDLGYAHVSHLLMWTGEIPRHTLRRFIFDHMTKVLKDSPSQILSQKEIVRTAIVTHKLIRKMVLGSVWWKLRGSILRELLGEK